MDEKLKEAIEAVREGDKQAAQRQLTELLDKEPQQVQGWYLLSLLVDSPQKQAAYLSKTLSLNPEHEKAKAQLAALQATGSLAPTASITDEDRPSLDVVAQSETDALPSWLMEEADGEGLTAVPTKQEDTETAVLNETLPDWLKEPAALEPDLIQPTDEVQESPTVVGQTAEIASKSDEVVAELKKTVTSPKTKASKSGRSAKQGTQTLNLVLGFLIILAIVVMALLAYLLLA